jgi:hypothetical protein
MGFNNGNHLLPILCNNGLQQWFLRSYCCEKRDRQTDMGRPIKCSSLTQRCLVMLTNVKPDLQDRQGMIASKYILQTRYLDTLHIVNRATIMTMPRAYEDVTPAW